MRAGVVGVCALMTAPRDGHADPFLSVLKAFVSQQGSGMVIFWPKMTTMGVNIAA